MNEKMSEVRKVAGNERAELGTVEGDPQDNKLHSDSSAVSKPPINCLPSSKEDSDAPPSQNKDTVLAEKSSADDKTRTSSPLVEGSPAENGVQKDSESAIDDQCPKEEDRLKDSAESTQNEPVTEENKNTEKENELQDEDSAVSDGAKDSAVKTDAVKETPANGGKDSLEEKANSDEASEKGETHLQDDNQNVSSEFDEEAKGTLLNVTAEDITRTSKSDSEHSLVQERLRKDCDTTLDKENSQQSAGKEGNSDTNDSNPSFSKQGSRDFSEDDDDSNSSFPACLAPEVCITEDKEDSNCSFLEKNNADDSSNHEDSGKGGSPPILVNMTEVQGDEEPMEVDDSVPKLTEVSGTGKDELHSSGDGQVNGSVDSANDKGENVMDIAGKGYVTDTMNELLGLFGEKVDESMKEKLQLTKPTNNADSPESQKKDAGGRMCAECGVNKGLKYQVVFQGKTRFLCSDNCFQVFRGKQKLAPPPSGIAGRKTVDTCNVCKKEMKNGQGYFPMAGESKAVCSEDCMKKYQQIHSPKQACAQCKSGIEGRTKCLTWETMEFCNEHCLGKYQAFLGSHCACCQAAVQRLSLGKYCVRFGSDIRQFCSGRCLEEFKKGLKVCTFCQKDLSSSQDSFLAPVGDRGQFKDFCSQQCMEQYETVNNANAAIPQNQKCSVCKKIAPVKVQVKYKDNNHILCSDPCIAAFRYANKINTCLCDTCHKFFDNESLSLQFEGAGKRFCSKLCMNLFVLSHRKIVPCTWCKVKKYNFDMIERVDSNNHVQLFCSLNCLSLFRVSLNATSSRSMRCDHCQQMMPAQYHLTMSDASIRNFCSYKCVIQFQNQFTSVPTLTTATPSIRQSGPTPVGKATAAQSSTPVIASVMSLAPSPASKSTVSVPKATPGRPSSMGGSITTTTSSGSPMMVKEVLVKHPLPKVMKNKALSCKPVMQTKGVSCKPHPCHKSIQTDSEDLKPGSVSSLIPIPVPIYVPVPVHMYSRHVPFPLPFPIPIPMPIFIPTTKSTTQQIVKQISEIQEKIPENPFEAELLMMAEMVAADGEGKMVGISEETTKSGDMAKTNDIDHKSVKSEFIPEVPLDLEAELLPSVTPPVVEPLTAIDEDLIVTRSHRSKSRNSKKRQKGKKRTRANEDYDSDESWEPPAASPSHDEAPPPKQAKSENCSSDANLCLKYMFGVNAWKHWVVQKNNELEKGSQSRKLKLFKTDLLQLSPDELNYSLCLFVKEVRKPNGEEYAPDSIYYLCLGIQLYLFENSRIDNIFTDPYYEKFTECLNEVVQKQDSIFSGEGHFVSRIEEEILWESKQLGAHSPHVLLNTLMYFNTKFFALKTMDSHLDLSFSHIMKHWRKGNNNNNSSSKSGKERCALLRYYPPANGVDGKKEKEYYEQVENLSNPLRCPVKLYEFYLSKCPESVKTRSDIFYLYPERSCVPDSPVWYSTQALGRETVAKMLQRIKMVQDINKPFPF